LATYRPGVEQIYRHICTAAAAAAAGAGEEGVAASAGGCEGRIESLSKPTLPPTLGFGALLHFNERMAMCASGQRRRHSRDHGGWVAPQLLKQLWALVGTGRAGHGASVQAAAASPANVGSELVLAEWAELLGLLALAGNGSDYTVVVMLAQRTITDLMGAWRVARRFWRARYGRAAAAAALSG
jgi:hypothetical protein